MEKFFKASVSDVMNNSKSKDIVISGFNIPYVPMMEAVIKALIDTRTFGLIMVTRLE